MPNGDLRRSSGDSSIAARLETATSEVLRQIERAGVGASASTKLRWVGSRLAEYSGTVIAEAVAERVLADPRVQKLLARAPDRIVIDIELEDRHAPDSWKLGWLSSALRGHAGTVIGDATVDRVLADPRVQAWIAGVPDQVKSAPAHSRIGHSASILSNLFPKLVEKVWRAGLCEHVVKAVHEAPACEGAGMYYANLSCIYDALGGKDAPAAVELRDAVLRRLQGPDPVRSGSIRIEHEPAPGAPMRTQRQTHVPLIGIDLDDQPLPLLTDLIDSLEPTDPLRRGLVMRTSDSPGAG